MDRDVLLVLISGSLGLLGALLGAIITYRLEGLREKRRRAVLDLSIKPGPPDCHKVPYTDKTGSYLFDGYYLRLAVRNGGGQTAENVEVYMVGLLQRLGDGTFTEVEPFLPLNLRWAYTHQVYYPMLSKGVPRHCDLAHIIDPKKRKSQRYEDNPRLGLRDDETVLSFDVVAKQNLLTHLQPPGTYRIPLIVSASNAEPVKRCVQVTLTGKWYEDEDKMLAQGKGVSVSLVDPGDCFSIIESA
jgi:hypothetical protein